MLESFYVTRNILAPDGFFKRDIPGKYKISNYVLYLAKNNCAFLHNARIIMRGKIKIFLIILFAMSFSILAAKSKHTHKSVNDNKGKIDLMIQNFKRDSVYQTELLEQKKQIATLTQTVADTKQSFYDNKLNTWDLFLAFFALLIAIFGYIGYNNISGRIDEIRADLLQRLGDNKADNKEFKIDAKAEIEKGLGSALQNAMEKIMKSTFGRQLSTLEKQIAEITKKIETDGTQQVQPHETATEESQDIDVEEGNNEKGTNAFDEDDE